jgi:hypothetical protein
MNAAMIMDKLGGTRFQILARARDFNYPQNGISFRLARPTRGIDRVLIVTETDGFTMTFFQGPAEIATVSGVAENQLRETFVHHTGIG